jgi:hypothetical protein
MPLYQSLAISPAAIAGKHAGEPLGAGILGVQRNRKRQKALEQFRGPLRRVQRIEPIFFAEIMPKTLDLIGNAASN